MANKGHPQTDGQSENAIRTLSEILQYIIQDNSEGWDLFLSELEFDYNPAMPKSTGLTLFEVDHGFIPKSKLGMETGTDSNFHAAVNDFERHKVFQSLERDDLDIAQAQKVYYISQRGHHVSFDKGALVMLNLYGAGLSSRTDLPKK